MNYKKQIEIFDKESEIWDAKQKDCSKEISRVCDLSGISKGQYVLDVGCGTGIMDFELIKRVGNTGFIKAIDISQGMINVAKTKFDFHNLDFEVNNIETIKDNIKYDAIICNNVFPHFINIDKVLINSYNLLKPKGKFIVSHLLGRDYVNNIHKNTNNFSEDKVPVPKKWIDIFVKFNFKKILSIDEKNFYMIIMEKI